MSWTREMKMRSLAAKIELGKVTGLRNLKQIRQEHGLTQKALAEAVGAELSTIREWEQLRFFPNARYLPAIASVLECSIADLF